MAKINLPPEILQKEAFKTLPAKGKEEYVSNLLGKILQLNPEGVTISQIKEATGITYSTVWHHLEVLHSTEQCHKLQKGNTDIFFPNTNASHLNDVEDTKNKSIYSFSIVDLVESGFGRSGKFVYIHKKSENRSGNQAVCSGLSIPHNLIDDFISVLSKVKKSSKISPVTAEELLKSGLLAEEKDNLNER